VAACLLRVLLRRMREGIRLSVTTNQDKHRPPLSLGLIAAMSDPEGSMPRATDNTGITPSVEVNDWSKFCVWTEEENFDAG
jgi:hypothetical protein